MSVNELERNETIDRVYTKAKKILKYVNDLVSRDFGIKATTRDLRDKAIGKYEKEIDGGVRIVVKLPKQLSSHNKRNDYFILVPEDDAFDDHGELTVFEIPEWKFEWYRNKLLGYSMNLTESIRAAWSEYVYYPDEYYKRRQYQTDAISACGHILDCLEYIAQDLPISIGCMSTLVQIIEEEIKLIKDWRKRENNLLSLAFVHENARKEKANKGN